MVDNVLEELEGVIGTEAANRLVDHYSGSSLYFPQRIIIKQNYLKIREEYKNGASYKELAICYGYTEGHIRRIIHGRKFRGSSNKNS